VAEELIAGAATLEDLERAAIGTADNRWRIARFNGRAVVHEARHMAGYSWRPPTCREPRSTVETRGAVACALGGPTRFVMSAKRY